MPDEAAALHTFRVHFHDGTHRDVTAASSLIAEARARKAHPGGFVKKIKRVREAAVVAVPSPRPSSQTQGAER